MHALSAQQRDLRAQLQQLQGSASGVAAASSAGHSPSSQHHHHQQPLIRQPEGNASWQYAPPTSRGRASLTDSGGTGRSPATQTPGLNGMGPAAGLGGGVGGPSSLGLSGTPPAVRHLPVFTPTYGVALNNTGMGGWRLHSAAVAAATDAPSSLLTSSSYSRPGATVGGTTALGGASFLTPQPRATAGPYAYAHGPPGSGAASPWSPAVSAAPYTRGR